MPERFSYVKRGYDPEAVDKYLEKTEIELKSYREKSAVINDAIISAQQAADNIIQNAKNQGRIIRESTAKQLEDIFLSVSTQRQLLTGFVQEYDILAKKYFKIAENEDFIAVSAKVDALENFLRTYTEEVSEDLEIDKNTNTEQ